MNRKVEILLPVLMTIVLVFLFQQCDQPERIMQEDSIRKITVTGNHLLKEEKILNLVKPCITNARDEQSLAKIKRILEEQPYIVEAFVKVELPSHLVITIQEFEPVAIYVEDKTLKYVDDNGNLYPYESLPMEEQLMVISRRKSERLKSIQKGIAVIRALQEYPVARSMVHEIHFEGNDAFLILSMQGIQVKFDYEHMHENFLYLEEFIKQYGEKFQEEQIRSLDLTFQSKIITSKRGLL